MNQSVAIWRIYIAAMLFILPAVAKIMHPAASIDVFEWTFGHIGAAFRPSLLPWLVGLLVGLELACAAWLIMGKGVRSSRVAATIVLAVFSLFLVGVVTAPEPPACGCLGGVRAFQSERVEGLAGLVRNGAMLALLWPTERLFRARRLGNVLSPDAP